MHRRLRVKAVFKTISLNLSNRRIVQLLLQLGVYGTAIMGEL
jgi:hypothetical protein